MSAFTASGFKFTINTVSEHKQNIKLPSVFFGGSLIIITALGLLTNPSRSIEWAIAFFGLLFILLISLALITVRLQGIKLTSKVKQRIVLATSVVVISMMLRSAGSLSLVDLLVLVLIFSGSVFYFSRRN